MTDTNVNPFDFDDTSDLPAELASRLAGGGRVNPNIAVYANIVVAAKGAGFASISMAMIEGAALRMGIPAVKQQVIRTALTGAVKAGLIVKVTRQTYGVPGTPVVAEPVAEETPTVELAAVSETVAAPVAEVATAPEADPLA